MGALIYSSPMNSAWFAGAPMYANSSDLVQASHFDALILLVSHVWTSAASTTHPRQKTAGRTRHADAATLGFDEQHSEHNRPWHFRVREASLHGFPADRLRAS